MRIIKLVPDTLVVFTAFLVLLVCGAVPARAETSTVGNTTVYINETPSLDNLIDFSDPNLVSIDNNGFVLIPENGQGGLDESVHVSIINDITDLGDNGLWDNRRNGYVSMDNIQQLIFHFESPVQGFGVFLNAYQDAEPLNYTFQTFGADNVFWGYTDNDLTLQSPNQGVLIGAKTITPGGFNGFVVSGGKIAIDDLRFTYTTVPEPVSAVLMLLGGGVMSLSRKYYRASRLLRRRHQWP